MDPSIISERERRSVLLNGIFVIRSCSSVGKTEAKSFFVGQSFNLRIRGRPPCSSSFKRTKQGRRETDFFSVSFVALLLLFKHSKPSQNCPRIVSLVWTGVSVSQSQRAGVSRWSIMCSLNASGRQSVFERFSWTRLTSTGELLDQTFRKNYENDTQRGYDRLSLFDLPVEHSHWSIHWRRADDHGSRIRYSRHDCNRSLTRSFGRLERLGIVASSNF